VCYLSLGMFVHYPVCCDAMRWHVYVCLILLLLYVCAALLHDALRVLTNVAAAFFSTIIARTTHLFCFFYDPTLALVNWASRVVLYSVA